MSLNQTNPYDIDPHVAELYDRVESGTEDILFIRKLLGGREKQRILEPFCGTGRVILPLAEDGHTVCGLDQSAAMLERARARLARLPNAVQLRATLLALDVTTWDWPTGFDLVILGGNSLYEMATPEEQEGCIAAAARSLAPGGALYLDSNHMEGDLAPDWRQPGVVMGVLSGVCADGSVVENLLETTWYDAPRRLVRFKRHTTITLPGGQVLERTFEQQKHLVSLGEVEGWILKHSFVIEGLYGDRQGTPYHEPAGRMIFWARKQ